jgi:trk system potassium uptake protein TrkA
MFVLVLGAGRVGERVARFAMTQGHTVSVLDEDPLALDRLDAGVDGGWEAGGGRFAVGTALEASALEAAGISEADMFIASTNGDNTNIVMAQIARERYGVEKVLCRVADPARADWYESQGLEVICGTRVAIGQFESRLRA